MTRFVVLLVSFLFGGLPAHGEAAESKQAEPYSKRPEVRAFIREHAWNQTLQLSAAS